MPSRRGHTLVETLVVLAILAILAAIAVPNYVGIWQRIVEQLGGLF